VLLAGADVAMMASALLRQGPELVADVLAELEGRLGVREPSIEAPPRLVEPPQPAAKPSRPSPPAPSRPSKPASPPAPVAKSHYGVGELDGKPRLLRHGSATFPPKLARRGVERGTVVLEVELDERGRVKIRRVVSATHSELIAPARRVAASASFTAPTRNGRAVKSIMRWPITIRR
jgi:TonB family protein